MMSFRHRCLLPGLVLFVVMLGGFCSTANACRFWVAVGDPVSSQHIQKHLDDAPAGLKALSQEYRDGWSAGYFTDGAVHLWRGSLPAYQDPGFAHAQQTLSAAPAELVFAHLRRASSGCRDGVPNPHPFRRLSRGKEYFFGHNGDVPKALLIELIGEDVLARHPPVTCPENPPDSWVDSELYFIYLLKEIEKAGDELEGIRAALLNLTGRLDRDKQWLNFFLTDGTTVWALRQGPELYYGYQADPFLAMVTSTPPDDSFGWQDVGNGRLVVFNRGRPPEVVNMMED